MGQRVDALAPEAQILKSGLTGFGERYDREGAETNVAPTAVDDDAVDERPGAGRTDIEVEAEAVPVPPGTELVADARGEPVESALLGSIHECLPAAGEAPYSQLP